MADKKLQIVDMMGGEEVFFKQGPAIQESIYYKVKEELQQEFKVLMDEVSGEFKEKTPDACAAYVLALLTGENIGASAVLARECLKRAQEILDEINELSYIAQNIDQGLVYKLDLATIKRYGFKDRGQV